MVPFLVAAALAAAPSPCPSDLLVANPRLKVVRARDASRDNYVVTVDVTNRGTANQPEGTRQHLALVRDGTTLGTQPVPALGANESYAAAFRVQLPHERKRGPFSVEFRYVLDSKNAPQANCTSVNDRLTATL
ncbi:MAG TPA: CARDB domain-containing protein [Dongiaceae bacterium]|nr:CARDB domain-containing protein [Dongiaceae bacterium]